MHRMMLRITEEKRRIDHLQHLLDLERKKTETLAKAMLTVLDTLATKGCLLDRQSEDPAEK